MKKFLFSIMLIAAAAAALISCGKSPELENKSDNPEVTTIKLVANAFTPETKTVIENDYSVSWEVNGRRSQTNRIENGNIRETYVNTGYNRVDAKNAEFTFDLLRIPTQRILIITLYTHLKLPKRVRRRIRR